VHLSTMVTTEHLSRVHSGRNDLNWNSVLNACILIEVLDR